MHTLRRCRENANNRPRKSTTKATARQQHQQSRKHGEPCASADYSRRQGRNKGQSLADLRTSDQDQRLIKAVRQVLGNRNGGRDRRAKSALHTKPVSRTFSTPGQRSRKLPDEFSAYTSRVWKSTHRDCGRIHDNTAVRKLKTYCGAYLVSQHESQFNERHNKSSLELTPDQLWGSSLNLFF